MENFSLRAFRVVARTLNLREATQGVADQPAIMQQIKALKKSLEFQFLNA